MDKYEKQNERIAEAGNLENEISECLGELKAELRSCIGDKKGLSDIVSEIEPNELGDILKHLDKKSLEELNSVPFDLIRKYINLIDRQRSMYRDINNDIVDSNFREVFKAKELRNEERIDAWKLWRDRLARWIAGVFIALLVYSSAVWLSEKWNFFKVPIRDMVKESMNEEIIDTSKLD